MSIVASLRNSLSRRLCDRTTKVFPPHPVDVPALTDPALRVVRTRRTAIPHYNETQRVQRCSRIEDGEQTMSNQATYDASVAAPREG